MAYTINKTDGTLLTTIVDGILDESTNLSLPGKGYTGYGESQNENFVKLLENFADVTANAPSRPLIGQLFYDKTIDQMQVYDGSNFRAISGTIVSATEPTFGAQGDLWYNSNSSQIYVYSGTAWGLVGPATTSTTGSVSDTIIDNTGTTNNIIKLLVDNSIVGIISDNEFTPQVTLTGYPTVKKGITLGTNISGNRFQGTATDADALGGVLAANYLRSNVADTMTGTLTIANDNSLVLGADNDIVFSQAGSNFTITNSAVNGDIVIRVNDAGVTTTAMTVDGDTSGIIIANDLTVSGTANFSTVSMTSGTANLNNVTVQGNLTVEGTQTILNTATVEIEDPILLLSNNTSGAPSQNAGIEIKRGSSSNKTLIWNETTDKWTVGSETFVAGTFEGNITGNVTGNVIGNTTGIHTGNVTGDVTGNVTGNLTGDVTASTVITNTISSSDSSLIELQDSLRVTGSLIVNSISSDDSAVVTIQDGLHIGGPITSFDSTEVVVSDNLNVTGTLTADSIVGTVITVGSSGSPVTTNQTVDLSTARFVEVYVNADLTLDFTNAQAGTMKRIVVTNTGATIRNITYKIDGTTQGTVAIGDGSTTNTRQLYELYSFATQQLIAAYNVIE